LNIGDSLLFIRQFFALFRLCSIDGIASVRNRATGVTGFPVMAEPPMPEPTLSRTPKRNTKASQNGTLPRHNLPIIPENREEIMVNKLAWTLPGIR
jgi:hypothetical protein